MADEDASRGELLRTVAEFRRQVAKVGTLHPEYACARDKDSTIDELLRQFQEAATSGSVARGDWHEFSNLLVAMSLHAHKLRHGSSPGDENHTAAEALDAAVCQARELMQRLRGSGRGAEVKDEPVDMRSVAEDAAVVRTAMLEGPPVSHRSAARARSVRERCGPKGRILVVDDEPTVRDVLEHMLASLGYTAACVRNGQEAVDYYREHGGDIDLVLLDLTMPVMNGWYCFRALKELDPGVKVLLATGHDLDGVGQGMLEEGVAGFLEKPYIVAGLSESVAKALGR